MRRMLLGLLYLLTFSASLAAQDIVGFWKSIDDKTGEPRSIVAIYAYEGKRFGRLIATYNEDGVIDETIYNPKTRAPGVMGDPYYCGLDFIWNLRPDDDSFSGGEIMDPQKGKVYRAELWIDNGNLIVRGKLLFFGRNQTWPPALDSDFPKGFKKPDLNTMVPAILKVK